MNLRTRFALHAGLHVPGGAGEAGGSDMSCGTCPEEQSETSTAAPQGEASPVASSPLAWSGAYARGVYRLFVRGRATRPVKPPLSNHDVPANHGSPGPATHGPVVPIPEVTPRHGECAAPGPSPASAGSPTACCLAEPTQARHVFVKQTNDGVVMSPQPVREVAVATPVGVAADVLALGPDVGGYVRRVIDWPLVPGARPPLLGGALARLELPDATRFCGLVPRLLAGVTPGSGRSPVVFLDLETTALDRGAGALAFMVGIAGLVDGVLRVEQWILTRLSSEAAMLAGVMRSIEALAGPGAVLSSFNGASFDLPLLRTRLRRAGLSAATLERPHLDLLPPARRMWRGRGPDCRLVTLERTQLAVRRVHDIAGHEIPAVFWAWLRRPNDPEVQAVMARVADHNLADLITLPALAAALCRCMTAPQDLDMAIRAAEHSRAAGRPGEALELLEAWYPRPAAAAQRRRALLLAAELLRGDLASRTRAAELWAEVCRISPGDPAAHEALAKYLEHHAGDPARALEVARASALPCPRRLARLQRKLTTAADASRAGVAPSGAAATGAAATEGASPVGPGPGTPAPVAASDTTRSVPGPLRSGHLSC